MTSGDNVGWARPAGPDPTPGLVPQYLAPPSSIPASAPPQQPYWPPQAYGQPYYYTWVPLPVVAPPKRSNGWVRWLVGIVASVIVLAVLAVGALVAIADQAGALDTHAAWRPGGAAAQAPDLPPADNAPLSEWSHGMGDSLGFTLAHRPTRLRENSL